MQLILVRHAQPVRIMNVEGPADPELAPVGLEQAERVPGALDHHRISRVVSSSQRRALDTAGPTAAKVGLGVDVIADLAEYDRDLPAYIPIEDAKVEFKEVYEQIKAGYFPPQIDGKAFKSRVLDAVAEIAATTDPADTVVAFTHGGVINVLLQEVLDLELPLTFPIDYCSITRVLFSRTGRRTAATVNENGHVWDLLPRNIKS
ncbi:histidine phosphatase family protein [Nocardia altamirensis]|uniref:histidine phosphatase family protein n=1 Tax=Nocardia altamirensis TaxID=472158 RepID=UPI00083FFBDE|nr:histidine phosphatase family protein [Nocardia altamirensis]